MDIIIPLGKSKIGFLDLKYVLRAIEKYASGYDEIIIIGEKPQWIQGVVHLPFEDHPRPEWKERNIYNKIVHAFSYENITDDVFFMNDDHLLLNEIDIENYPYYYKGSCYGSMLKNSSSYRKTMHHTKKLLERRGFEDINADIHTPIIFNKKEFLSTFEPEHWLTPWGYGVKSLYCAFNRKPMTFMEDLKIHKKLSLQEIEALVEGRHMVSCTDAPLKAGLGELLELRFPDKSSYER